MDTAINSLNQILWFLHRTIFEHVPASLTVAFTFLTLGELKDKGLNPLIVKGLAFLGNPDVGFIQTIVLLSIVFAVHSAISGIGHLLFVFPYWEMGRENLSNYPYLVTFQEQLNRDFANDYPEDSDGKVRFQAADIYSIIRYEIMQNKKEFNTFLWYDSTKNDMYRNFAVAICLVLVILLPVQLGVPNKEAFLITSITSLASYWILFKALLREKFKNINKIERDCFLNNEEGVARQKKYFASTDSIKSRHAMHILEWHRSDKVVLAVSGLGLLIFILTLDGCFSIKPNGSIITILKCLGVVLGSWAAVYVLLICEFIENKSFDRLIMDAFISMKYSDKIFGYKQGKFQLELK